ncbi:MAG: hypothetical protein UT41_C0007G0011 [Candidatus Wolfebacteria bacterium GW2011_GWC2_39_22]|uniref:Uncharacterized protein n=1 Tax=Candidatus Wolfebacteria bacterium GW2011_GWC2_39_22 TaxID=1619013 RepID=A0A0G0N8F2_9BACT|nr:MAG: hypothetical protein UT41_C0007G0011 [Candidatus Wolfebacteria bacterium GW2011_GWC2_39_22]
MSRSIGNMELMNTEEFAAAVGGTSSGVYHWLHYGKLPENLYVKIGKNYSFIVERVEKWILQGAPLNKKTLNKKISA